MTLDTPPLDIGVEDHATAAPLAVRTTEDALGLLEEIGGRSRSVEARVLRYRRSMQRVTAAALDAAEEFLWLNARLIKSHSAGLSPLKSSS